MKHDIEEALSFDDVLIIPSASSVLPKDVDVSTTLGSINLATPIISASMDTVTEAKTAISMAQEGGLGIIHKNWDAKVQANEVRKVKKHLSGIVADPISVSPNSSLSEIKILINETGISGFPVTDNGKLVGIVTHRDIQFETDMNKKINDLMTPLSRLVTAPMGITPEDAKNILHKHRIEKLPLIDGEFRLKGLITVRDIETIKQNPNATKDFNGRLRVGAGIGVGPTELERAEHLIEAGVDAIVIDTAHGHSLGVIEMVKSIRNLHKDTLIVAGNIATAEAAEDLIKAGADVLKVGVGPGSICTTRIVSGCGIPQFTAIMNVCSVAKKKHITVIADGGIKYSGDITKALSAGASAVMIGSLFAGTEEAPGEMIIYKGRSYKTYRGMGSLSAMMKGSKDRYGQADVTDTSKLVPEGIEGRVPYRGHIKDILYQMVGGLKSGMGYVGCKDLSELHEKAKYVRITSAGNKESHVHDVDIIKEAPNYWGK